MRNMLFCFQIYAKYFSLSYLARNDRKSNETSRIPFKRFYTTSVANISQVNSFKFTYLKSFGNTCF